MPQKKPSEEGRSDELYVAISILSETFSEVGQVMIKAATRLAAAAELRRRRVVKQSGMQ